MKKLGLQQQQQQAMKLYGQQPQAADHWEGQQYGSEEGNLEIDLDQITDSMIMQEDIDENYQPTQEEVVDYARFLGMDMVQDKDLFYIAKEGLKAPLPEPWRPVKHPSGEMFYLNLETREVSWDHPCDQYYQELYRKEKEKKMLKATQTKMKQFNSSDQSDGYSAGISMGNKPKKTLPVVLPKHDIFSKKNDPLIKVTQEKKLNEFRNQQKQKLQERKKEIEDIYKRKFEQLEEQHTVKLEKIKEEFEAQKQEEEDKLQNTLEALRDDSDAAFRDELDEYEREIKEELKKTNKTRIEAEKKAQDTRLQNYKISIHAEYDEKLQRRKQEIKETFERQLRDLEREEQDLKADPRFQDFNEEEELENLKRKFLSEQEEKFERERDGIKRKYADELRQFKEKENERHKKKMDELYSSLQKESKASSEFDAEGYKKQLEEELQAKIKMVQSEVDNKYELEKLNVMQKLKEYEMQRKGEFERRLEQEVNSMESQWQREKEKKEQEMALEKAKIEQKAMDEYLTFKNAFDRQMQNEEKKIRDLFNSEQQILSEKEKISTELVQKLHLELQKLTEECDHIRQENKDKREQQLKLKGEIEEKKKRVEYSEKERVLIEEISAKERIIGQLKQQIDELDDKDLGLDIEDMLQAVKANNGNINKTMQLQSADTGKQQQLLRGQSGDSVSDHMMEGYSSDGSAISFGDNQTLKLALSNVSTEIEKERKRLFDEKLQIQRDMQVLMQDYTDKQNDPTKKSFFTSVKTLLDSKMAQVDKKLKRLGSMKGAVSKTSPINELSMPVVDKERETNEQQSSSGYSRPSLPQQQQYQPFTQSQITKQPQGLQMQIEQQQTRGNTNSLAQQQQQQQQQLQSSQYQMRASAEPPEESKFVKDINSFLSKYQQKPRD